MSSHLHDVRRGHDVRHDHTVPVRRTPRDGRGYDVLVVGAGSGGLATAVSAARHGARVLVVDRRTEPSHHPRATGLSPRTMEILRIWGIDDAVRAHSVRVEPTVVTAATLVAPPRESGPPAGYPSFREILAVSPAVPLLCPQDLLEPVMADAARRLGVEIRFGAGLVALHVRPGGGPDAVVAELATGERVHARFVVGADGARSTVRAQLGIGVRHLGTWAEAVSVLFRPDLAPLLDRVDGRHRLPHPIYFLDLPRPGVLLPAGAGRWVYADMRYDGVAPEVPAEGWTPTLRAATGLPDLEPEVLDVQRFTVAAAVATAYRRGPGFLVGDAAHRTTPVPGVGLNTAVADGHELGWKLAWVARGLAGEGLLDSHEAERAPIGLAVASRSLLPDRHPDDGIVGDLGRTHRSAVVAADDERPAARTDLAARPGERAPHVWLRRGPNGRAGRRVSTLDLFDGRLTLVTGDGTAWAPAATTFDLQVLTAAEGSALARAYRLGPDAAVLVRPDGRVAWRRDEVGTRTDRRAVLADAVATALGHAAAPAALAG
jgi:2-polyprenyl-6-methoxyphenol hydroxylase-like FAD-dependent oxidoreductase